MFPFNFFFFLRGGVFSKILCTYNLSGVDQTYFVLYSDDLAELIR